MHCFPILSLPAYRLSSHLHNVQFSHGSSYSVMDALCAGDLLNLLKNVGRLYYIPNLDSNL